ncbi:SIMPL domain-containing protein [Deefgea rivuli]|uniref:SIMPL domain-containing protein n=1 Tax=Deefgea rivuli TaxID=400948 RepID=UPI0004863CF7|nr:SIMPL domain-containing protein [Deefgea rivuli]
MRHFLVAVSLVAGSAWAADVAPPSNVVNFEAQATREVANDLALATLFVEFSDADPARLAEKVNLALAGAIKQLKQYPTVQSGGTSFATYPLYAQKSNKQEGWRSRGELRLSSKDFAALSKLVGELQKSSGSGAGLQLAEVRYAVSDEMRSKAEESLIEEGIALFKRRAGVIQKSMAANGWKMMNMNVNTSGSRPEMRPMMMMKAAMMDSAVPAPIEGGESRLQVNVSGSIQLAN